MGAGELHAHGTIDIHAHFYPKAFLDLIASAGGPFEASCDFSNPKGVRIKVGSFQSPPLDRNFVDIDLRLQAMDERRVEVHALSLTVPMVYWAGADLGRKLCETFNDALVEAHEAHPNRLVGLPVLPMHEPDLAVKELDRVAKLPGACGVYAATQILDREISDAAFFPVFERLEDLGLPLFLHPLWVIGANRLGRWHFDNLLGNPFDNAVAAAYLIFDGILDRFPKLEVCLPHAGGALLSVIGRLNHGWTVRPDLRKNIPERPPLEYLRRFYYDTITHSPSFLEYLIGEVGADRVMLGSDYCYAMGYDRPVEIVSNQQGLSDEQRRLILGGNAARLLSLNKA